MRRIASTLSVAPLLLAACVEAEPIENVQTDGDQQALVSSVGELCPAPRTLAFHLAQGPGKGGFHYDPAGTLVEHLQGRYNRNTDEFRWSERFHPDALAAHRTVQGEAVTAGADQELHYQVSTEYRSGAITVKEVEESWSGCSVERRTRRAGGTDADWYAHSGSYADSVYQYIEEQQPYVYAGAPRIEVTGATYANGTWVEYFEGEPSWFYYTQTRTGNADGYLRVSWEQDFGDGIFRGTDEFFLNGTQRRIYINGSDGDCPTTWVDYTIDRDSYGTGTALGCFYVGDEEWPEVSLCTLTIAPGSCTQTCENGVVTGCNAGRAAGDSAG